MTTQKSDSSRLLRLALRANAVFSAICAVAFLCLSKGIADFIGHARSIDLTATGVSLLLFAVWLLWIASRRQINRAAAWIAVAMDTGWVLFTAVLLIEGHFNSTGKITAGIVALIVVDFAFCQYFGLRRLRPTTGDQAA
jgi:hypothetical protein